MEPKPTQNLSRRRKGVDVQRLWAESFAIYPLTPLTINRANATRTTTLIWGEVLAIIALSCENKNKNILLTNWKITEVLILINFYKINLIHFVTSNWVFSSKTLQFSPAGTQLFIPECGHNTKPSYSNTTGRNMSVFEDSVRLRTQTMKFSLVLILVPFRETTLSNM
jgi:hypothetical protein